MLSKCKDTQKIQHPQPKRPFSYPFRNPAELILHLSKLTHTTENMNIPEINNLKIAKQSKFYFFCYIFYL